VAGRSRSIEKSNDLIGNQTCDLPACSIVPQPTALLHAPLEKQLVLQTVISLEENWSSREGSFSS
jgi:hypothetical protein